MKEMIFKIRFYRGKVVGLLSMGDEHTLGDLHDLVQEALGWDSDHLFEFIMEGTPRDPDRKIYSCEADKEYAEEPRFLGFAEQTKIGSLNLAPGQRFFYHFDYGENWFFEIFVAGIKPAQGTPAPKVLERNGKMPEQY